MTKPLDPTKPVQLRDGTPAEIYSYEGNYRNRIHARYKLKDVWHSGTWNAIGEWTGGSSDFDLVNVPTRIKRECWVNVYPEESVIAHPSKEAADAYCSSPRLACVHVLINCEEGEGL